MLITDHLITISELDSPDLIGSGERMQQEFYDKLLMARLIADIPFRINSGFRTIEHNRAVGGSENSSHLNGWAVDVSATDSRSRSLIVHAAIRAGVNRIGVRHDFIHLDSDPSKAPYVLWVY